jgi:hypothetical protein
MKIFASSVLLMALLGASNAKPGSETHVPEPMSVTALINESIMPIARGEKYERALEAFLEEHSLGEIVGGGTALGPEGGAAWVEIVIELTGPESSVEDIAGKLAELGAPEGSHLYYYVGDEERQVPIR